MTACYRTTGQRARTVPKLGVGLIIVGLLAVGCGGSDETSTSAEPTTTPAPTEDPAPERTSQVSVAIECQRGESLSELDADMSRTTFVPDDAPDDTT